MKPDSEMSESLKLKDEPILLVELLRIDPRREERLLDARRLARRDERRLVLLVLLLSWDT